MSTRTMSRKRSPAAEQGELFAPTSPAGFRYKAELISSTRRPTLSRSWKPCRSSLSTSTAISPTAGYVGFGLRYDYGSRNVVEAPLMQDWFIGLRDKVGAYRPPFRQGARPGSHRRVPGRRRGRLASGQGPVRRDRRGLPRRVLRPALPAHGRKGLGPLDSDGRTQVHLPDDRPCGSEWEHSVPPVTEHRYSITFRTLAERD